MVQKIVAVICAALLLAPPWLSSVSVSLFVAFVPLLWLSDSAQAGRRGWWSVCGWATLTFVLWNVFTILWIGNATPVGPVAAILVSTFFNIIPFMLFHSVRKRASKALSYTLLISAWIAAEYYYMNVVLSWPWLLLGNGFSGCVEIVQWYEYTGVLGGSLWVLLVNILIYEWWCNRPSRGKMFAVIVALVAPISFSLYLYYTYAPSDKKVEVSIVQPNVDCYDKFNEGTFEEQNQRLLDLAAQAPADVDYIIMPETSIAGYLVEQRLEREEFVVSAAELLDSLYKDATIVAGATTIKYYFDQEPTSTARHDGDVWYDVFNSSLSIQADRSVTTHHKGKLVVGVESTPELVFDLADLFVIDLGGMVGQLGVGQQGVTHSSKHGVVSGAAICYEGLYGEFFGDFVRNGAEVMFIISNDGWWGDTQGYKRLFTISRLRAIESRRSIARSANTGRSGFINARGDVSQTLGWDEQGVITEDVEVRSGETFYTRYGDYLGRVAQLAALLCLLFTVAQIYKKRNNLD